MLAPDAIIPGANSRHREALVLALGGAVQERAGSRVRVELRDIVSFQGESVETLRDNLAAAVDDYLSDCAERGIEPEKPASGRLMLRIPPEVHGAALVAAQAAGKSLNQWAAETLAKAAQR